MAYETDSLNRRTIGPAVASAVVGIALGAVAVAGVSILAGQDTVPSSNAVTADDALLGGPEYGSRQVAQDGQTAQDGESAASGQSD